MLRINTLLPLLFAVGCGSAGGFRSDAGPGGSDAGPGGGEGFTERRIDEGIVHGQGVETVDIDRDGDLDVIAALSLTDSVHIYLNEGGGGMWSTVDVGGGNIVAMEVEAADLDGDGDLDIAAVGLFERALGFNSPGEVTWFENPGDVRGSWTRHEITGLTFPAPIYVEAGDLTGNGSPDLVVAAIELGSGGNGVHWFRNTGGTFEGPLDIDADLAFAVTAQLVDVDGDGVTDVVAAGRNQGELVWYENGREQGSTALDPGFTRHSLAAVPEPNDVQLANLDDDPALEAIASYGPSPGAVAFFDPPADPTQPWVEVSVADAFGFGESARVATGDFDADQDTDIAVITPMFMELRVYTNDGGTFTEQVVSTGYNGINFVAAGDIDGDGREDLVTSTYANTDSSDIIAWWSSDR